ncbi:hypothetical protein KQY30_25905 [Streptomyces sp. GMY02]|uniref:hypothetical protein n=1 Tax=Streptomyces sp. GMY02 TaxID=1333528 RepID=UPI001C2CB80F|nr:hypothetical protein [Streptomyces sp. GMY02]QXE37140.1 hypothetical protein KQY30_25905 [Streptomyces sp. GMY02]
MSDRIKEKVREVLVVIREVEKWREDHDPGTDEWYTLCNLADLAEQLVFALPVEMLPDEEVRTPDPREYGVIDEILAALGEAEAT